MQRSKRIQHIAHGLRFSRADAYVAGNAKLLVTHLRFGLLHQRQNFLGALTQAHAVPREHA